MSFKDLQNLILCLLTASESRILCILRDVDSAMLVTKQLPYENANKYCQEAICPHRNGNLNDFIQLFRDIDDTHVMVR